MAVFTAKPLFRHKASAAPSLCDVPARGRMWRSSFCPLSNPMPKPREP